MNKCIALLAIGFAIGCQPEPKGAVMKASRTPSLSSTVDQLAFLANRKCDTRLFKEPDGATDEKGNDISGQYTVVFRNLKDPSSKENVVHGTTPEEAIANSVVIVEGWK